ncbi:hypothetical protein CSOJ01_08046 [Colletotrichum sojae]|uniref:Uncharacterized protein n=1 Tax=Colletotrichum sojae TaxID=2175907 RepID=A0A8H6J796_9PEZI|nr:hypothetical protein CSOJ01_08046 [Colletotrichum sojae]
MARSEPGHRVIAVVMAAEWPEKDEEHPDNSPAVRIPRSSFKTDKEYFDTLILTNTRDGCEPELQEAFYQYVDECARAPPMEADLLAGEEYKAAVEARTPVYLLNPKAFQSLGNSSKRNVGFTSTALKQGGCVQGRSTSREAPVDRQPFTDRGQLRCEKLERAANELAVIQLGIVSRRETELLPLACVYQLTQLPSSSPNWNAADEAQLSPFSRAQALPPEQHIPVHEVIKALAMYARSSIAVQGSRYESQHHRWDKLRCSCRRWQKWQLEFEEWNDTANRRENHRLQTASAAPEPATAENNAVLPLILMPTSAKVTWVRSDPEQY